MSFGISGLYSSLGVHTVSPTSSSGSSRSRTADDVAAAEGLRELHGRIATHLRHVRTVHDRLEGLRAAANARRVARVAFQSDELSSSAASYSTLTSTEEINTTATSYDERGELFLGTSTSTPTVGGTYDGRYGTDTLEFRVVRDRTVGGSQSVQIDVYDSGGSRLERITWEGGTPADTEVTSDSGLNVSLSPGDVVKDDNFYVDVYDSVGTDVDVDDPFDGTRSAHPEIEDGFTISDGSFELNGTNVAVNASDSLQEVIDRINAAGAGATVALSGDQLVFTADTLGAEEITLTGDTSGFLDAMKLSSASVSYGATSGADTVIEDVAALDGIASGTFSINGTSFTVDVTADTLGAIIDAINAADVGAVATLDDSGRFTLSGGTGALVLDDGTSGFFTAMDIAVGTHQGQRGRQITAQEAHQLTAVFEELSEGFSAIFEELERGPDSVAKAYRQSLANAVGGYFLDDYGNAKARHGLLIDFEEEPVWAMDHAARVDFFEALTSDTAELFELLLGDEDTPGEETGFLDALLARLEALDEHLGSATRYEGLLVSTYA